MKLKLALLLLCLLGVGLFTQAQKKPVKSNVTDKVVVVDGKDALPITVKSNKKSKVPKPPSVDISKFNHKPEQPAPPPPPEKIKIRVNKYVPPPPPPRPKTPATSTIPDVPSAPDKI